ncbi:MAG: hypothetical protein ACI9S9_003403 [Planctomycetota bacterium]|jgi:hypothetical protein
MPNLETLALPENLDTSSSDLRTLRLLPKLRGLVLAGDKLQLDRELAASLIELPQLELLATSRVRLTAAGITALAGLPHLKVLYIERSQLEEDTLAALGRLRTLRCLTLHGNDDSGQPVPHLTLRHLQDLRLSTLTLSHWAIDDDAFQHLPHSLEMLGLVGIEGLTTDGLRTLRTLPRLRGLGPLVVPSSLLPEVHVLVQTLPLERFSSSVSAPMWKSLQQQPKLRRLDLRGSTDIAADVLRSAKIRSLEFIRIGCDRMPAPGELAPLVDLPKLQRLVLNISGRAFTTEQVTRVRNRLGPKVEVRVQ